MGGITHSYWHTSPITSDDSNMCILGSFFKKSHVTTYSGTRIIIVK